MHALEESRDFQSRSNLDSIRRHTMALVDEQHIVWNDVIFLRTMKSIVQDGDVDLCSNILAELSPSYKRKRANSLSQRMSVEAETPESIYNPPTDTSMIDQPKHGEVQTRKVAPHRPAEHDKWKIIPKKVSDKAVFD